MNNWIDIESGQFPEDNQEVLCWNGEKVVSAIYKCDDREKEGYTFEVQKYPSFGERLFVSNWIDVTHWQALPAPPVDER